MLVGRSIAKQSGRLDLRGVANRVLVEAVLAHLEVDSKRCSAEAGGGDAHNKAADETSLVLSCLKRETTELAAYRRRGGAGSASGDAGEHVEDRKEEKKRTSSRIAVWCSSEGEKLK